MKNILDNSIIEAKTAVNNCHVHINLHIFQNIGKLQLWKIKNSTHFLYKLHNTPMH